MSYVDQMKNLRLDIEQAKKKTAATVGEIKQEAHKIQNNAKKMVREFASQQKADANILRDNLAEAVLNLEEDVKQMRNRNVREQKELRVELKQGADAFWGRSKIQD